MKFPSREWCEAAAAAMLRDPAVTAAIADFGPVVVGVVIQRGSRLPGDFCVLARLHPGRPAKLSYPEDEDELEELEPDYVGWASYDLCRELLEATFAGKRPDPLQAILKQPLGLREGQPRDLNRTNLRDLNAAVTVNRERQCLIDPPPFQRDHFIAGTQMGVRQQGKKGVGAVAGGYDPRRIQAEGLTQGLAQQPRRTFRIKRQAGLGLVQRRQHMR